MQFILFLIGLPMSVLGRVRFGSFVRSGSEVRAAGVILMLPFAASLLFSGLLMTISGNWTAEARRSFIQVIGLVQLVGQVIAMFAAWWIMRSSSSRSAVVTTMPNFLREWGKMQERARKVAPSRPAQQKPAPPNLTQFPSVMNTRQAAAYLQVPEQTILELITNGNLIAARINHRYTIARSVLDEYRNSQAAAN